MSLRKAVAPSSTLLKYLRAQQDGLPFFTANRDLRNVSAATHQHSRPLSCHGHQGFRANATAKSELIESSLIPSTLAWPTIRALSRPVQSLHLRPHSRRPCAPASRRDKRNIWAFTKWFGRRNLRPTEPLQPDDLPPLANILDEDTSLGRIVRAANEQRLRCTEYDENGNATILNGEFKKTELIAKVCPP